MELKDIISGEVLPELKDTVTVGIDIGSRMGKIALLTKDELYVAQTATSVNMQETADYLLKKVLKESRLLLSQINYIVGTGYGRISLTYENIPTEIITEISCHGMGAHFLNVRTQTIVDIGGQDSKAIRIDPENGKVVDFVMNDKCAAGTGRFLERVGELLELDLKTTGQIALDSRKKLEISSQCVVFAESEIVTLRAKGEKREDIVAAVNLASARRVRNLVNRIGLKPELIFSGGVSNNPGMKKALEEVIGHEFSSTKLDMSYNGALGAAIFAQKYYLGELAN